MNTTATVSTALSLDSWPMQASAWFNQKTVLISFTHKQLSKKHLCCLCLPPGVLHVSNWSVCRWADIRVVTSYAGKWLLLRTREHRLCILYLCRACFLEIPESGVSSSGQFESVFSWNLLAAGSYDSDKRGSCASWPGVIPLLFMYNDLAWEARSVFERVYRAGLKATFDIFYFVVRK